MKSRKELNDNNNLWRAARGLESFGNESLEAKLWQLMKGKVTCFWEKTIKHFDVFLVFVPLFSQVFWREKPLYFFFHSFLQKIIFGKKTEMRATNEQTLRFTKKSWTQKKGNDSFVPKKVWGQNWPKTLSGNAYNYFFYNDNFSQL